MGNNSSGIVIGFFVIISIILGVTFGGKKRIGSMWAIFFLLFWFLPGVAALILSPPLKNLPPERKENKIWNIILGIFAVASGIGFIQRGNETNTYFNENASLRYYITACFFFIAAIYMFLRSDRNKRMYEEQEFRKWKKIENKDDEMPNGMPPPPEELDIPIYDQV